MKYLSSLALLAALSTMGCTSDDSADLLATPPTGGVTCKPGEVVACGCPGAATNGVQTCQPGGKSFGLCIGCPSGNAGSGGSGDAGMGGQSPGGQGGAGAHAGSGGSGNAGGKAGGAGAGGKAGGGQAGMGQAGTGGMGQAGMGQAGKGGQAGSGPVCGDGVRQPPGEQCDGGDLAGQTCTLLFGADFTGTLGCTAACKLDTTQCKKTVDPPTCGDGKINQVGEECDISDFAGKSCASVLGVPTAIGALTCDAACHVITDNCIVGPACGDGHRDLNEQCDGNDTGGATCASVSGDPNKSGVLGCTFDCFYDISQCTDNPFCGDGALNAFGEQCDSQDFGGATCQTVLGTNQATGFLACSDFCELDTSGCSIAPYCGDGIKNDFDECDGFDFGTDTCESLLGKGFGGDLSCLNDCTESTDQCFAVSTCGDGIIDAGESCDGAALGANGTCAKLIPTSTGTVSCNSNCTYNTTKCTLPKLCGNGKLDAGEDCDGALLNGATCASVTGDSKATGKLACKNTCSFDTSGCVLTCGNGKLDPGEECDDGNNVDDGNRCDSKCKVVCEGDELKFGTHCYLEYPDDSSWTDAKATCAQDAGHLVTITTQEEFDFLFNNVLGQEAFDDGPRWIGLDDTATKGSFFWITGEAVGVVSWASGQPTSSAANQDCVDMGWDDGKWSNHSCSLSQAFICEFEPPVKP